MRQPIEEESILDVLANYTTYDTYHRLANTAPAEDPEVPNSKASAALARFVSLQPTNLARKAAIIVEHFRQQTAGKIGGQAKAMVVARSRLHAVRYKQAIDAYIAKQGYDTGPRRIAALVAFSGTIIDPASPQDSYTESLPARNRRIASRRIAASCGMTVLWSAAYPYGRLPPWPLVRPLPARCSAVACMRSELCSDSYRAQAPSVRATARPLGVLRSIGAAVTGCTCTLR
jgi:hypothetical protein